MANPVTNNGVNNRADAGHGAPLRPTNPVAARVTDNQGQKIFDNVSENYGRNPNHGPQNQHAQDAPPRNNNNQGQGNAAPPGNRGDVQDDDRGERGEPVNRGRGNNNEPDIGEDGGNRSNRGNGGNDGKGGDDRSPRKAGQTVDTPPIIVEPQDDKGDRRGKTQNTPPLIVYPNDRGNNDGPGRNGQFPGRNNGHNNNHIENQRPLRVDFSLNANLRANGNQPNNVIARVVSQILGQNDIYLNTNAVNRLINGQVNDLPRDTAALVRDIGQKVLSVVNRSNGEDKLIHLISKDIARQLRDKTQAAGREILRHPALEVTRFGDLSANARLGVAADLLPPHLPEKAQAVILAHSSNDVVNGLLLARGIVAPNAERAETSNLVAFRSAGLSSEMSMSGLRDVGLLVKGLIADTAIAKSTANLDLAVGKFVKILLANNELGVLLATISLAAATQNGSGNVSRSLALSQIYELINKLIETGHKAARTDVEKTPANRDESLANPSKTNDAAGHLRQYLEFNPAFMFDNSVSSFTDPSDARAARSDFVELYHDDIEQWLKSGNHRLVRDFDFERPVGIVVERGTDEVFNAQTARFVLVRDGSFQGWHFLKALLVR